MNSDDIFNQYKLERNHCSHIKYYVKKTIKYRYIRCIEY